MDSVVISRPPVLVDDSYAPFTRTTLPEQLAGIWKRRKWLMLLGFFLVFPAGVAFIQALPQLFRAATTVVVTQGDISKSVLSADRSEDMAERLDIINKALLSRSSLQELINRFNLYPQLRAKAEPEYVIERMRRDIGIQQQGTSSQSWDQNPTYTLTLSYQSWDPQVAADVTNELAALYSQENIKLLQRRNTSTTGFLSEQLEEVSNRLAAKELAIRDYRNQNQRTLPEQQGLSLTTLERLNAELALNGEKQLQLMNQRETILTNMNTAGMPGASQVGVSRLDALRGQLSEMQGQYTDRHPEIIRLKNEIAALEKSPERAAKPAPATVGRLPDLNTVSREMDVLVAQQKTLEGRINDLQARIESTPGVEQELLRLNHEYDSVREEYLSVQKRYQEARMSESLGQQQQNEQLQVIEPAIVPKYPVAPASAKLIFLGFFLSLAFCAGLALMAEQFDTTFHSLQDVRGFTSLPVLGSIARIDSSGEKLQRGMRKLGISLGAIALVVVLLLVANYLGGRGEEFVWLLAGRAG